MEADEDNSIDIEYTYDSLGRILTVEENGLRMTRTIYDDDDLMVRVETDLETLDDGLLHSVTHYDELGRAVLTRVTDGSTLSASPTATDGIKVATTYITATGGNRVVTSTPYRTTSDPTLEWSCTQYDENGRVAAAAMFTGSTAPTTCTSTTNRTAYSSVEYDADRTELADSASKVREEYRDALGRLTSVMEAPGSLRVHGRPRTRDFRDSISLLLQRRTCPAAGVPDGVHDHVASVVVDGEVHVVARAPQQDPMHALEW